ncbi:MAG TPA: aromatic ring-hydroxylating dioxygenase subunit alpha [Microthrixaceae bacterium]|nr:aromatic ring-hydroxylating dioxygenase subunit alpha [Microthrixaceae bacterium]
MAHDAAPLEPTGRFTTVRLPQHWHVACLASELGSEPIGRTVLDVPLALFRDGSGRAVALVDRCPHRNVPLSLGRCDAGELECRYHGWRFDGAGECVAVPGLDEARSDKPVRRVATFPVHESDGMVWVVPAGGDPVQPGPPHLTGVGEAGYRTVYLRLDVPGPMLAAVENALDVPHTSFLHRGLFRGRRERVPVSVTVRHGLDRVEAEFAGEPVPPGLAGRLLAPDGGVIEHTDRFIVPAMAQVEYRLGARHVVLNAFYTPVGDDRCVLHAAAAYRLPLPTPVVRGMLMPLARWILHQDNWVLRHQRDNVARFGGERFVNTPIDLLGPHILRLLRRHERGETDHDPLPEEHLELLT